MVFRCFGAYWVNILVNLVHNTVVVLERSHAVFCVLKLFVNLYKVDSVKFIFSK